MWNINTNILHTLHYILHKDEKTTMYQKKIDNSRSMSVETAKKDGSGTHNLF